MKGFAAVPNVASLLEGTMFPPTVICPPTPNAEFIEVSPLINTPLLKLESPPTARVSFKERSPVKMASSREICPPTVIPPATIKS